MNDTLNETNRIKTTGVGLYRPKFALYHPNGKGTGCAIEMELHPAHDDISGCIMLRTANQLTIGDRKASVPQFPRFDWANAIQVKLDFNDLCKMLQVFRGECETIDGGRGLYHRSCKGATRIILRHYVEPSCGYSLELYRTPPSGEGETRTHFIFGAHEALGLAESIAGSMSVISFGIPMLIDHAKVRQAYAQKGVRDASAA